MVFTVVLEYRKLGNKDIPALKKLSRSLKTSPSITTLGKKWLADLDCFPFGCFSEKKQLICLVNLRKKSKNLAWIEGIHIHPDFPSDEIITDLVRFIENFAKTGGYKNIGFMTETSNQQLITLGEKLQYESIEKLCLHQTIPSEYTFEGKSFLNHKPLPLKEAIIAIRNLNENPKEEIYLDADYLPLDYELLRKINDLFFYENKGTILIEHPMTSKSKKSVSMKGILIGSKEGVVELLNGFIRRSNTIEKPVFCLCQTNLCSLAQEVGFAETDDFSQIVLFKKKIK